MDPARFPFIRRGAALHGILVESVHPASQPEAAIYVAHGFVVLGRHCEIVSCSVLADSFDSAFNQATAKLETQYPLGEVVLNSMQRIRRIK
jgi:hypothetical protein